jgi:hypothetical protein
MSVSFGPPRVDRDAGEETSSSCKVNPQVVVKRPEQARCRQILATHKQLAERLAAMEKKYDRRFKVVFDILKQLMEPLPDASKRPPLGFVPPRKNSEALPPALDPMQRVFVVSMNTDVPSSEGQTCALTPGDILIRNADAMGPDGQVSVTVLASKAGDCPINSTSAVDVVVLQEMHNHFREQIDSGLTLLATNRGKGVPHGPAPKPRLVSERLAEPDMGGRGCSSRSTAGRRPTGG